MKYLIRLIKVKIGRRASIKVRGFVQVTTFMLIIVCIVHLSFLDWVLN